MALGLGLGLPYMRGNGDPLTAAVKALFASGEKGVLFDLTRAANLYTDSARTTLVTASGDRIGSATDLSPNGKHASSTSNARPIWDGYATFDAFDDYLQTAAIDFTATDAVTVVASIYKAQSASAGMIVELSSSASANNGSFWLFDGTATASAGNAVSYRSRGSANSTIDGTVTAPAAAVVTGASDISDDLCIERINGVQAASGASDQGAGSLGNYGLNIGSRNTSSLFFNGRIYRLLVIGRALTTTERNAAELWAAQPVGIAIP